MFNKKVIKSFSLIVFGFLGFAQFDCAPLENNRTNAAFGLASSSRSGFDVELFEALPGRLPNIAFDLVRRHAGLSSPGPKLVDTDSRKGAPHGRKDAEEFFKGNEETIAAKLSMLKNEDGSRIDLSLRNNLLKAIGRNPLVARNFLIDGNIEVKFIDENNRMRHVYIIEGLVRPGDGDYLHMRRLDFDGIDNPMTLDEIQNQLNAIGLPPALPSFG